MTTQEAIEVLSGNYLARIDGDEEGTERHNTAIDMAISALQEQIQRYFERKD